MSSRFWKRLEYVLSERRLQFEPLTYVVSAVVTEWQHYSNLFSVRMIGHVCGRDVRKNGIEFEIMFCCVDHVSCRFHVV